MSEASHKKVIVIGDGHVGKTCFVAKVTENKFIPNYLPTMGGKWNRGAPCDVYTNRPPVHGAVICGIDHPLYEI